MRNRSLRPRSRSWRALQQRPMEYPSPSTSVERGRCRWSSSIAGPVPVLSGKSSWMFSLVIIGLSPWTWRGTGPPGRTANSGPLRGWQATSRRSSKNWIWSGCILIGHSLGGPVSLVVAAQMPRRIVGVIGVDTIHSVDFEYPREAVENLVQGFRVGFHGHDGSGRSCQLPRERGPVVARVGQASGRVRPTARLFWPSPGTFPTLIPRRLFPMSRFRFAASTPSPIHPAVLTRQSRQIRTTPILTPC